MYQGEMHSVSSQSLDDRIGFIRRTYAHLGAAILAFVGLEVAIFSSGLAAPMAEMMLSVNWLLVLGAFMIVGWGADWLAHQETNPAIQYVGLIGYVIAEAVLFVPLLFIAANYSDASVIPAAGLVTGIVFAGLTVFVFVTKKDFSFLRGFLVAAGLAAMAAIAASILFGFGLGVIFSFVMVLLASGYILYQTSNILHHYHTTQHVAASLALFSSVALLFWYILSIFMSRD